MGTPYKPLWPRIMPGDRAYEVVRRLQNCNLPTFSEMAKELEEARSPLAKRGCIASNAVNIFNEVVRVLS